ncbi:MAG: PDZ domain-containing protein [Pyrinomonadaceae bacterium]|nr:PDZ domain-containing protein [Pyrinomonadaceae bacterium]
MAKSIMEQLLQNGRVRRGMLGVNIQTLTEELAEAMEIKDASGVIVSGVRPGSAAEKAGLRRGDVITAVNGEKIADGNVLRNKIAGTLPGTEVKLTIQREGGTQEVSVVLDEFNSESASADPETQGGENAPSTGPSGKLGVTLQPVTPQLAKQFGSESVTEGLVVMDVDPNGAAADAGISRGDIIIEVNRRTVTAAEDVEAALQNAGGRAVMHLIARRGSTIYLPVRPR